MTKQKKKTHRRAGAQHHVALHPGARAAGDAHQRVRRPQADHQDTPLLLPLLPLLVRRQPHPDERAVVVARRGHDQAVLAETVARREVRRDGARRLPGLGDRGAQTAAEARGGGLQQLLAPLVGADVQEVHPGAVRGVHGGGAAWGGCSVWVWLCG
jgi:hypothetical protein